MKIKDKKFYICDPDKNEKCRKTFCHQGFCYRTSNPDYKATGKRWIKFFLEAARRKK